MAGEFFCKISIKKQNYKPEEKIKKFFRKGLLTFVGDLISSFLLIARLRNP